MSRISIFILSAFVIWSSSQCTSKKKPNIIFFFVDDMGWQDTSVPFHTKTTILNERYFTPNMQILADEGMKFTQAYACAVCSPSRISLMTGMNAARHQVTNWTLRKDTSPDPVHPGITPPEWNMNGLSPEPDIERTIYAETLPGLLRQEGYRTIHVGKAHFGAKGTLGENPLNLGFDINIAGHAAGGPGSYYGKYNFSAAWRNADRIWDIPGLDKYHGQDIYLTEALTIEANRAIDRAVADKTPFYLYMSHYAIHAPWEQDERYYQKYIDAGLNEFNAAYASMIESMDKSLGDIMANVAKHGIEDNTLVIFMSDNGQPSQATLNKPLRGHKLTPYEGGIRVPFIARWPGKIEEGTTNSIDYIIIEDIFPTFLEIGGVSNFDERTPDGVSFTPLLEGKTNIDPERPIFWHFPHTYDQPAYSAVRKGDWKVIYHHLKRKIELFNVMDDIGETRNLSEDLPEKVVELTGILSYFLKETHAGMPTDKETGELIPYPNALIE